MKILITGIQGFAGSYLAKYVIENNLAEVHGIVREKKENELLKKIEKKIKFHECDVTEKEKLEKIVKEVKPEIIFHLAAQASVADSLKDPRKSFEVNLFGTMNLLEAVKKNSPETRIIWIGSSEEYGVQEKESIPIKEESKFNPITPYAVSKIAADYLCKYYSDSMELNIIRIRPFNHTGPYRGERFVLSNWCKQVAEIEKGLKDKIRAGNIGNIRDFSDVRDVVKAYWIAAEKGKSGEVYNVCSGTGFSLEEMLRKIISLCNKKIIIEKDNSTDNKQHIPVLIGDNSKIKKLGWKNEIPLEQTLNDLLNYWRNKLK